MTNFRETQLSLASRGDKQHYTTFDFVCRAMEAQANQCSFCSFTFDNPASYATHILRRHQHEGAIFLRCTYPNCMYNTNSWHNYKQHCRRQHALVGTQADNSFVVELTGDNSEACDLILHEQQNYVAANLPSVCQGKMHTVKFLLHMESRYQLTRQGTEDLTCALASFIDEYIEQIRMKFFASTQDAAFRKVLDDCLADTRPKNLDKLRSLHSRQKLYEEHFNFIPPESVFLSKGVYLDKRTKRRSVRNSYGYIVPLKKWLQLLLNIPQIWEFVQASGVSQSRDLKYDFSDGSYLKEHRLSSEGSPFLKVVLSYDDVEIQNPLRSNKKHKLAMFYFTLLNIPPQHRSKLRSIFPFAICRSLDLKKKGIDNLLRDFISTIGDLRKGLDFEINGITITCWGDLIGALCDTPAAALLGGFKESSSFARQCCRMCDCDNEFAQEHFCEDDFRRRDMIAYEEQCRILEENELSANRQHWSKHFGVNRRSVLCGIEDFPVTSNLLQDPMHCILEGVLPFTTALFLNHITAQETSIGKVNTAIQQFSYSYLDVGNRPPLIESAHVRKNFHVKMKAASCLTMVYVFPFVLAPLCDTTSVHYENFMSLIRIAQICFSPIVDDTTPGVLAQLIQSFCQSFTVLYPEHRLRPKFHFLVHLPTQMQQFGPLRHHSTMRFEAKHGFFKDHRWRNFNNLPKSLLSKHQLWFSDLCSRSDGSVVGKLFNDRYVTHMTPCPFQAPPHVIPTLNPHDTYKELSKVSLDNFEYRKGCALLLEDREYSDPKFGVVENVLMETNHEAVSLVVKQLEVVGFQRSLNAYHVKDTGVIRRKDLNSLQYPWPLSLYLFEGERYITNRFSACNPFL